MKSVLLLSLIIINALSYQPANNNKNKFGSAPPPHAQNDKPKPTNSPPVPTPIVLPIPTQFPVPTQLPDPTQSPMVSLPTAEPSFKPIFRIDPPIEPVPLNFRSSEIGLKE